MNARAWKWMKRGLWTLGSLAAIALLALGYLWVGGVLLDRGPEVDDPDIADYEPVRESSPGAQALLDMCKAIPKVRYYGMPEEEYCSGRDLQLLRHYANTVDHGEFVEHGFVLGRFEADDAFRRAWIAEILSSNQFVFAALDRADGDADFRFADSVAPIFNARRFVWRQWTSDCIRAWEGPVLAQLRFDAESGDTAAMTAHFARNLRVLGRLKGSGGMVPLILSAACQAVMVDGMSSLVDEYDFNVEDLARLDQILASASVVQEADWHRARIREHGFIRRCVETLLDGSGSLEWSPWCRHSIWPEWLQRLGIRYAYQPRKMLGLDARWIADEKAAGFDLNALKRRVRTCSYWTCANAKTGRARERQWWRPGFRMCQVKCRMSGHMSYYLEGCDMRDRIPDLRKKIADRVELKRRGGTPVLKKRVFGRPADEENQSE